MTNRLVNRIRHSTTDLEVLSIERLGRSKRGFSLQTSSLKSNKTVDHLPNKHPMNAIEEIEKVNRHVHLENILYSWYLRRVECSKMIETFAEFDDESDIMPDERQIVSNRSTVHAKLPEIARRFSAKKSSLDSSNPTPLWTKLVSNWRDYMYEAFLSRVEQEKLSIAAYEIEQTKLDWERMKMNAQLSLEHYDVLLRAVKSDEVAQQTLNNDLEKNIDKHRHDTAKGRLNNSNSAIPIELLINRIIKRIHSRISLIGLLRINTARTQLRIRAINLNIYHLEHSDEKMHEIDVNFVRTRKIDYVDTFEKLDRQFKIAKSSQYPVLHELHELQKKVVEQEEEKTDYENRYQLLENRLEKINQEIECIQRENEDLSKENNVLTDRLTNIKEVPSITNYAYVIERTKKLQHQIDVWSRRVTIAETLLSQMQQQTKGTTSLPPIRFTTSRQRPLLNHN